MDTVDIIYMGGVVPNHAPNKKPTPFCSTPLNITPHLPGTNPKGILAGIPAIEQIIARRLSLLDPLSAGHVTMVAATSAGLGT